MKRKILSLVLALCLILPCAFMLSACKKDNTAQQPVAIAGKSLQGTSECFIVWREGVTEQDKTEFFSNNESSTEEELKQTIKQGSGEHYCALLRNTYNAGGTVTIQFNIEDMQPRTIYYKQSADFKTIIHYIDAECTEEVHGDNYGPARYEWVNNSYRAVIDWNELFDVHFVFNFA